MPLKKGNTKYIFVSGGVISGIGKGITTASTALLLKKAGYRVALMKFENYLNVDAGTINPIEHGDPFLCDDGTEADMDIGTYEKFLDEDMGVDNFVTMGKIYKTVIDRERAFEYEGEDVEAIPHITDEIQKRITDLAKKQKADIVIIELGGTAGEYQNVFYYEASRIMTLNNPGDVLHIHVSYIPVPDHLGEPKTKPTQLSVKTLNSMGIQPDFIVARSQKEIDKRRRSRFALFCNLHPDHVVSSPDVETVYQIPLVLNDQKFAENIQKELNLQVKKPKVNDWEKLVASIKRKKRKKVTIAIVGKYFSTGDYELRDSYAALFDAIDHAAWNAGLDVEKKWVNAEKYEKNGNKEIGKPDGIIVPIGWGERGVEGMIKAASYARKNKIPYLGLCYGMQLAVVAFARDVLGLKDAHTTEVAPKSKNPVIHMIPTQKELMKRRAYGGTMRLGAWTEVLKKDTLIWNVYNKHNAFIDSKKTKVSERHRHRFEVNQAFEAELKEKGLVISSKSEVENLAESIELPQKMHPFYLGVQGHPEYKSRPQSPHPIFVEFLKAASLPTKAKERKKKTSS